MIRIGILGHGFIEWGGGLDFLRLVCGSLMESGAPLELHLLLPTRGPRLLAQRALRQGKRLLGRGATHQTARRPAQVIIDEFVRTPGLRITAHQIDSGSAAILKAARRLHLDVVLPSVQPLRLPPELPWIGYLADFQHRHLPQFFSAEEIATRDRQFAEMLDSAGTLIVNARAVAADARAFRPHAQASIVALPFCPAPQPAWFEQGPPPLARYGIEGPYFIICNQFWQHKDHRCAYQAFAEVLKAHPQMRLVCTGETSDFRHPGHFGVLQKLAADLGIAAQLKVLGMVPKADQLALLRGARALVQPTLFEGGPGGGAVYDAVSLGVPALVSDIAVNTEISEDGVHFFKTGDAGDLARLMHGMLRQEQPPPPAIDALLAAGRRRRAACGGVLLEAIDLTRQTVRGGRDARP